MILPKINVSYTEGQLFYLNEALKMYRESSTDKRVIGFLERIDATNVEAFVRLKNDAHIYEEVSKLTGADIFNFHEDADYALYLKLQKELEDEETINFLKEN